MTQQLRTHSCPLEGCDGHRGRTELVCRMHWFRIPKPLRDEVWRTYRNCGVLSEEYHDAVTQAFGSLGFDEDGYPVAA